MAAGELPRRRVSKSGAAAGGSIFAVKIVSLFARSRCWDRLALGRRSPIKALFLTRVVRNVADLRSCNHTEPGGWRTRVILERIGIGGANRALGSRVNQAGRRALGKGRRRGNEDNGDKY